MQSAEIELKFPVSHLEDLREQLLALGFKMDTPRTFESNVLYDTQDRTLRFKGELLRIRQYGGRWVVTHKRHPDHEEIGSRFKVRIETESEVDDGEALAEIFSRLGISPAFRYEKYRTEYSNPNTADGRLVLDETPIGTYCELEGPTEWIDQTLIALGVDAQSCLTASYGRLFTLWKKETGNTAENLTFSEVPSPELSIR